MLEEAQLSSLLNKIRRGFFVFATPSKPLAPTGYDVEEEEEEEEEEAATEVKASEKRERRVNKFMATRGQEKMGGKGEEESIEKK